MRRAGFSFPRSCEKPRRWRAMWRSSGSRIMSRCGTRSTSKSDCSRKIRSRKTMRNSSRSSGSDVHVSVLLREILAFAPERTVRILDATLGLGGHAHALLSEHSTASLLAFDRDEQALELARARLSPFEGRVEFRHGDFRDGLASIPTASLCYAIAD